MNGALMRHALGLHHLMARLAAELDGFRVLVGMVNAHGRNQQEERGARDQDHNHAAVGGFREVEPERNVAVFLDDLAMAQKPAQEDKERAQHQERRGDQIRQDADVGVAAMRHRVDQEQQQERKHAGQHERQSTQAHPVAKG